MAKRSQDLAAAKAKKQKIILIVGGVLLLAVAAFQGPKLMKRQWVDRRSGGQRRRRPGSGSAVTPVAVGATTAPQGLGHGGRRRASEATVVKVAPSQLASFTLFEVKDPFVPGVGDTRSPRRTTASQDSTVPPPDAADSATRRQPAVTPPPRRAPDPDPGRTPAAADRLRDDQLRRQAAAGAGEGSVPD